MMLSQVLQNCDVRQILGPADIDVRGLCGDSRRAGPGDLFIAIRGGAFDGHRYVADAIAAGAAAVVVEQRMECGPGVTQVLVDNSRLALALAAQAIYGDPTLGMPVVGVTGTNGKTTITYLLENILQEAGFAPAVVGTINYRFGTHHVPAPHTTPEPESLLARLSEFKAAGAGSLIMEVSSHALDQYRADGIHFKIGVFTNLTPEHLDYHQDMEHYFQSKCRLFKDLLGRDAGRAVVNIDDTYGQRLAAMLQGALTCGQHLEAKVRFLNSEVSLSGIRGQVTTPVGETAITSCLLGDYNVENLLCAIAAGLALGIDLSTIARGVERCSGVPGRLESIENDRGAVVLVDYAHTGDALDRVLEALQQLGPKRILTVFGCGGDRDRTKRPVMAEVAARRSTLAIATSDNPRTEDPLRILDDVRVGLAKVYDREITLSEAQSGKKRGYLVVPDRREAIRIAVSLLQPGDLLLVAGKGHEDYQILGTDRVHFDDREELRNAFKAGGPA